MRNTIPLMIAIALTAAPAAAQGTENTTNTVTEPATNEAAATDTSATLGTPDAMTTVPTNDLTVAPTTIDQPVDTAYGEPAPARKSGFPWGVLGLLGLLGLLPRKRRD